MVVRRGMSLPLLGMSGRKAAGFVRAGAFKGLTSRGLMPSRSAFGSGRVCETQKANPKDAENTKTDEILRQFGISNKNHCKIVSKYDIISA